MCVRSCVKISLHNLWFSLLTGQRQLDSSVTQTAQGRPRTGRHRDRSIYTLAILVCQTMLRQDVNKISLFNSKLYNTIQCSVQTAKLMGQCSVQTAKLMGQGSVHTARLMGQGSVQTAKLMGQGSVQTAKLTDQGSVQNARLTGQCSVQLKSPN